MVLRIDLLLDNADGEIQTMLTDVELERLFAEWKTPAAGRTLIRKIRADGPVRDLQYRMDGVRTRLISKKMGGRAVYAESRTCEFPGIYLREHDPETTEYWPQPVTIDLKIEGANGGATRLQHTPDLFVIEHGFLMEEWRELARLTRLAAKSPNQIYRDSEGNWHNVPVEKHFEALGIEYRLRCADEHPRIFLSNLSFLEELSLDSTPPVPEEERQRLGQIMDAQKMVPHLSLVVQHDFKADHIYQMVLDRTVYVDLYTTHLRKTDELILYKDKTLARAEEVFRLKQSSPLPTSVLKLSIGARFLYDDRPYEVALLGRTQVTARELDSGATTTLPLDFVETLFEKNAVSAGHEQQVSSSVDKESIFNEKRLEEALARLDAIQNPDASLAPARTLRRWSQLTKGLTSPQDQLAALVSRFPGNTTARLPAAVTELADAAIRTFHNKANNPKVQATFNHYTTLCSDRGVMPMSRTNFYNYVAKREDVKKREGKRIDYQKAAIPLTYDYEHPVHGVLPHEVCYCDHTILNVFLKGSVIEDLGKPTITLMVDGALSMARGFYLSYRPASTISVLMCLRDYVRRNRRLPRVLVLDNGKEFHSHELLAFCSMFGISIRWRRRSRPRDSSIVERMLGATEQEVISQLDGNSLALKDPRMVSGTHHPDKHISWTLPGLYGAIEYYLFEVHAKRKHPRFGICPVDYEKRMLLELGAREHVIVRFDQTFKLLTSPHSGKSTRIVDRKRGVFVDGYFYWHDRLALAKKGEACIVRVELWCARVVYVNFRGEWYVAQARDGGVLDGRYRQEFELQQKEEARTRRNEAQKDKNSIETSKKRNDLWNPHIWDPRVREQLAEMYYLYERLGMTEVLPEAKNPYGPFASLGLPKGSELQLAAAVEAEPGALVVQEEDEMVDLTTGEIVSLRGIAAESTGSGYAQRPVTAPVSPGRQPQSEAAPAVVVTPVEEDYF